MCGGRGVGQGQEQEEQGVRVSRKSGVKAESEVPLGGEIMMRKGIPQWGLEERRSKKGV